MVKNWRRSSFRVGHCWPKQVHPTSLHYRDSFAVYCVCHDRHSGDLRKCKISRIIPLKNQTRLAHSSCTGRFAYVHFPRLQSYSSLSVHVVEDGQMVHMAPFSQYLAGYGCVNSSFRCVGKQMSFFKHFLIAAFLIGVGVAFNFVCRRNDRPITISPTVIPVPPGPPLAQHKLTFFAANHTARSIVVQGVDGGCSCIRPQGLPLSVPPKRSIPIEIVLVANADGVIDPRVINVYCNIDGNELGRLQLEVVPSKVAQ